jgi:FG-GAP repeat protein
VSKRSRAALATMAAAALTGGLLSVTAASAAAETPEGVHGDFNHDGYRDVAVSAPGTTVAGHTDAGAVVILWGGPSGLLPTRRTVITQNSTGVPGGAETGDRFGAMTTAGDYNEDGYCDLVISAPYEDLGSDKDAGMVTVLWGGKQSLVSGAVIDDAHPYDHDRYGQALATGDFDGDTVEDLVIGDSSPTIHFYQDRLTSSGGAGEIHSVTTPVANGQGGVYWLTAGQVDGAGTGDDLVVDGLDSRPTGDYIYNENFYYNGAIGSGITGTPKRLSPGIVTGIGDTNGDGYGDLVIGEEWDKDIPGAVTGGKVSIRYGSSTGPDGTIQEIDQNTSGVVGGSEADDLFGNELSLGDVNGDGFMDLAVGSYGENLGDAYDTGAVHLFYGSPAGITTTNAQYVNQETAGVPGSSEDQDEFGSDVLLDDVNGDGKADLTIGACGENDFNGATTALHSDGTKIVTDGSQWMGAHSLGLDTYGYPVLGVNFAG